MPEPDHESHRQYVEEINKRQLSNNEAFDKAVLTLSSAGLGLSLTFFKFVVPLDQAECIYLLKASWVLFLCAIGATLISYMTSQWALRKELTHAEKYYIEGLEEYESKTNPASILTEVLNTVSGLIFVVALVALVLFVTANM